MRPSIRFSDCRSAGNSESLSDRSLRLGFATGRDTGLRNTPGEPDSYDSSERLQKRRRDILQRDILPDRRVEVRFATRSREPIRHRTNYPANRFRTQAATQHRSEHIAGGGGHRKQDGDPTCKISSELPRKAPQIDAERYGKDSERVCCKKKEKARHTRSGSGRHTAPGPALSVKNTPIG